MAEESRREFLLKLAQGAVYAAPVVRTLTAPESVAGQTTPSKKKGWDMTGALQAPGGTGANTQSPQSGFGPPAPWTKNP